MNEKRSNGKDPSDRGPQDGSGLAQMLDDMAQEERDILAEALQLDAAPGLELVGKTLDREWNAQAGKANRSLWKTVGTLVVAAAAVVVLFTLLEKGTPDELDRLIVGQHSGSVVPVHPPLATERAVEAWDYIDWSGPKGASYNVIVRPLDGEPFFESSVTGHRIDLTPEQTANWSQRILIEIYLDGGMDHDGPPDAEWVAERSSSN